ncbi:TVP38/TMEM64 family protein [Alteromonas sp. AMM-1]|uniref:TVP38/TMEM64 family protein n=1 Tax=Alteromonas sp. AMM-1 TaxID=3394233 RepID=UPI0039A5A755
MNKHKFQPMVKNSVYLLFILLACVGVSELVRHLPAVAAFNQDWVDVNTRNNGWVGIAYFVGMAGALTAIGLPRQLTAFLAGYAFGFGEGLVYSLIGTTVSCAAVFAFSRTFARRTLRRKYASKIARLDNFVAIKPFLMTIVIRLMPFGNNLATNLVAGVSHVPARVFITGSMIGYIPQMAIFALMGKGILVQSYWKIGLSVGMLGLSTLLGVYLYKQYKAERLGVSSSNTTTSVSAASTTSPSQSV